MGARWKNCVNEKTQYKCKTPPTGERTGENLDGKIGFDLTKLVTDADHFRSGPVADDIFTTLKANSIASGSEVDVTGIDNSPRPPTPMQILDGPWNDVAQKYMSMHKLSRGERLAMGGVRHVYHQTSMDACKAILKTGFRTGINGIIGNGMYFAEKSIETGRKTRHYGCMIEVLVRFGRIYNAGEGYGTNPPKRDRLLQMGFDAVTVVDVTQAHYGREFEIYHKDQIVDMFAYPCMARWTHCVNDKTQDKCKTPPTGERIGEHLYGKGGFDLSKLSCSTDDFRFAPIATDILIAPNEPIAV